MTTWTFCPKCGCGPGDEHRRECDLNPWSSTRNTYRCGNIQDPRFKDGVCIKAPVELEVLKRPDLIAEGF